MKILALQGGGCLGYGQALILQEIERKTKLPICKQIDLIGGTSVGSIIGAPLSIGIPASQIEEFFTKTAPIIFKDSALNRIEAIARPKYRAQALEAGLFKMMSTATLAHCQTKFIATSYDVRTDRPVYFKSYEKSSQDKDFIIIGNDSPMPLWQIARASSAAQSYFPAYCNRENMFMDGGNAGDNAPDVLLGIEALSFSPLHKIRMLSLGSGDSVWNMNWQAMKNPSLPRAGLATTKIVFSAGESGDIYKARRLFGMNHFRLSPDLGNGIAIDDAAGVLEKMPQAVEKLLYKNSRMLEKFLRAC